MGEEAVSDSCSFISISDELSNSITNRLFSLFQGDNNFYTGQIMTTSFLR